MENKKEVSEEVKSLREENERMREVLEWYANSDNYLCNDNTLSNAWAINKNIENHAKSALLNRK